MHKQEKTSSTDWFQELIQIIAQLRGENGCPWDRKQTHQSLRRYMIEETAEFLEALDAEDSPAMADELGDVLLQIVLHAQIATEEGRFTAQDIARGICEKMIRRHPHVFASSEVDTAEQVVQQWEQIKQQERQDLADDARSKGILDGVPTHLPALHRAYKIQKKAACVGFDWPDIAGVIAKVYEELDEVQEAMAQRDPKGITEELGDLLFAVTNLGRFLGQFPEESLHAAIVKFERRFALVEQAVARQNKRMEDCSIDELDAHWQAAKAPQ